MKRVLALLALLPALAAAQMQTFTFDVPTGMVQKDSFYVTSGSTTIRYLGTDTDSLTVGCYIDAPGVLAHGTKIASVTTADSIYVLSKAAIASDTLATVKHNGTYNDVQYTAGDQVGIVIPLPAMRRVYAITLIDKVEDGPVNALFCDGAFTSVLDNAAFSIDDSIATRVVLHYGAVGTWTDIGGQKIGYLGTTQEPLAVMPRAWTDQKLYLVLIAAGTPNPESVSDLRLNIIYE